MIVRRFNTSPMVRFRSEVDDIFGNLFGSFSPQSVFDCAPAADRFRKALPIRQLWLERLRAQTIPLSLAASAWQVAGCL